MPSFVMLLELNGVDMFLEATVRGFTETYNNKSSSYCRITFDTKFCSCEAKDPGLLDIVRNLGREFWYKKFPYEYTDKSEITLESIDLGEITLYNRNQKLETDIDINHCKTCWDRQNWN